MKKILQLTLLLSIGLTLFSCGNADDDVSLDINDRELGLGQETG